MNERLKKEISFILKDFLKVVKVVSMYPEDNPLPQSMRLSFAEKLVSIVEEYGSFKISVSKGLLEYEGEVVYEDKSKEESLAALFFDAGITDFEFTQGLAVEDVYKLLEAMRVYLNTPDRTEDLAGLFWESGVSGFRFKMLEDVVLSDYDDSFDVNEYLESVDRDNAGGGQFGIEDNDKYAGIFVSGDTATDAVEQSSLDDSGSLAQMFPESGGTDHESDRLADRLISSGAGPEQYVDDGAGSLSETGQGGHVPIEVAQALGLGEASPDTGVKTVECTTLEMNNRFSISEEEAEEIRLMLERDADFDPHESTLELCKEILTLEPDLAGLDESVTICEKIINEFVQAGRMIEAGSLLSYLRQSADNFENDKPDWSRRLREAVVTAGSRERLSVLAESMNAHPEIGVREIKKYLDNLGWEALSGITDLIGEFEHEQHREAIQDYLSVRGQDNIDIVARGIYDKRWQVVCNSVTILARIGDARSFRYLEKIVEHEEPQVRMELVTALQVCPSPDALELLKQLVNDPDRAIRSLAVKAITERSGRVAFETAGEIIDDPGFKTLDPSEQQALLKAYSRLGGDHAVGYLSQLILRYNLFRDSNASYYRSAAFEALVYNRSERAERLLIKLSSSWRPSIRRQAAFTLQRRREYIYGSVS